MRRSVSWVLAGSLGVVGVALPGCDSGDRPGEHVEEAFDRAGQRAGELVDQTAEEVRERIETSSSDLNQIRSVLSFATQAALNPEGLNDLRRQFTESDQARISQFPPEALRPIHLRADSIRERWEQRYERDFDIADEGAVFRDLRIEMLAEGETRHATAELPAIDNLPPAQLSLVATANGRWRIDIPEEMDGPDVVNSLLREMTAVDESLPNWPVDAVQSQRRVAHHLMLALGGGSSRVE